MLNILLGIAGIICLLSARLYVHVLEDGGRVFLISAGVAMLFIANIEKFTEKLMGLMDTLENLGIIDYVPVVCLGIVILAVLGAVIRLKLKKDKL